MCGTDTRTDRGELIADDWNQRVADAFHRAAGTYHNHAVIQQQVAMDLSKLIRDEIDPSGIGGGLEIGCGTGFLTSSLFDTFPDVHWTITDAATGMVQACRHRLGRHVASHRFAVVDGEHLDILNGSFDLVCSNLTFQWFTDLERSLNRMMRRIRPGGWLVFSTLANNTFSGIRDQNPESELLGEVTRYPDQRSLEAMFNSNELHVRTVGNKTYVDQKENLEAFIKSLKSIGAATTRHPGLSLSELRSALLRSRQSQTCLEVDYQVLFAVIQKR